MLNTRRIIAYITHLTTVNKGVICNKKSRERGTFRLKNFFRTNYEF